mgnify:CR=1 FL=1
MQGPKAGQHILVPIDFSKHSEKALLFAARLAKGLSMELLILHVVHDPADDPGYYHHRKVKKLVQRIEVDAQEMMSSFLEKLVKKHPKVTLFKTATPKLVIGLPVTRIIELAEKTQPFMIVLGSQGRTGLSRMLIGSKAETVLRLASTPVTIVK